MVTKLEYWRNIGSSLLDGALGLSILLVFVGGLDYWSNRFSIPGGYLVVPALAWAIFFFSRGGKKADARLYQLHMIRAAYTNAMIDYGQAIRDGDTEKEQKLMFLSLALSKRLDEQMEEYIDYSALRSVTYNRIAEKSLLEMIERYGL